MVGTGVSCGLQDLLKGGVIATLLLIVFTVAAGTGYAQCTLSSPSTWSLGTTGNWNVAGNWSPSGVPNSSSTNVCIVDGVSTVNLTNLSPTVDNLQLASGNALDISTNISLTVAGTSISNAGSIVLNGGDGANGLLIVGSSDVTLTGGGTVTLSTATGGGGSAYIEQESGGYTLTNSNNTIQGDGIIGNNGLAVSNAGTIDANVSGETLEMDGGGAITNTGLIEATGGGTLLVDGNSVSNAGGNITASGSGSTVQFDGATVTGGTLNTTNSGVMETVGSATLNGVTISSGSTYTASNNASTYLEGTITNNGAIQLNGGDGANGGLIVGSSNVTLSGGGTVTLATSTATGGGSAYIEQESGDYTLTNSNNTIQGDGIIGNNGLAVVNDSGGTIDATTASGQLGTLTLDGGGVITNQGLLEATTGTLVIENAVTNTGGNITANSGTVELDSATITGGTLNTTGGGTMETVGSATLDGVTISSGSTYTASNNASTYLQGTIANNGVIQLNGGDGANGLLIVGSSDVTLTGGGTVTLSTATGGGSAYIEQESGGYTLTNSNNTIQGDGIIGNNGLAVSNAGTIDANVSGETLEMDGGGAITNTGLIEATGGGTLLVDGNSVSNAGGNITASGSGSTVQFDGATVTGGTLNTTSGGAMETVGSATLDGSTSAGAVTLSAGSIYTASNNASTYLQGTIANNGVIQLNGGDGANGLLIVGSSDVTLTGGGTVTLSTATGGGSAYIEQEAGGYTLTNSNNTIQGDGIIGNNGLAVVNDTGGTISANISGQTLLIDGGGSITNNGTFEAASGATLETESGTFTNFSGTTLTGGTYDANGTIEIDQLGSTGGEIVTNDATIILDGSNGGAAAIVDDAGKNALSALATNEGSFTVENGGNADFTTAGNFANSGTVTVGTGTTLTTGASGGSDYTQSAGTTTVDGTLTSAATAINGGTLYGTGTVHGPTTIATGGTLQPGSSSTPGTLNVIGTLALNGTLNEVVNSQSVFNVTAVTGGITLGSGSTLDILLGSGFTPTTSTSLDILTAGIPVSGTFGTIDNQDFSFGGNDWQWNVNYNPSGTDGVDLTLTELVTAPTTVTADWTTGTPANWTTASNWACSPGASTCVPSNGAPTNTVYDVNIDNTASGATMMLSTAETVNTLALTAGTLDIASGGSLNLADQPDGITDIPEGAGLSVEGSFTTGSNSALANLGSIEGALTLDNGQTTSVTPGSGTLTVSSTGSLNVASASTALAVTGNLSNAGTVTAGSGGAISASGNYAQSAGTTTVAAGGTLIAGTYSQSAGTTDVNGTLISATVTINGGTLEGSGTIEGTAMGGSAAVTLTDATLEPGHSLTVYGSVDPNSTDPFVENIYSASNYGVLDVLGSSGTADISGSTLDIDLPDGSGFLTNGETFTILDATGGLTGEFSVVNGLDFGNGDSFSVGYSADGVTLTANIPTSPTPEPAGLLLFGTGLVALGWIVRRKRPAYQRQ